MSEVTQVAGARREDQNFRSLLNPATPHCANPERPGRNEAYSMFPEVCSLNPCSVKCSRERRVLESTRLGKCHYVHDHIKGSEVCGKDLCLLLPSAVCPRLLCPWKALYVTQPTATCCPSSELREIPDQLNLCEFQTLDPTLLAFSCFLFLSRSFGSSPLGYIRSDSLFSQTVHIPSYPFSWNSGVPISLGFSSLCAVSESCLRTSHFVLSLSN